MSGKRTGRRNAGGRRRKAGGFTLLEALIAVMLTAVVFYVLFNIFRTGNRMAVVGAWQSARQSELRVGLQLLRDDLARASYPSTVRLRGVDVDESYKLKYKSSEVVSPGQDVLVFYISNPAIPAQGKNGCVMRCSLSTEEGRGGLMKVRYKRELESGDEAEARMPACNKVIFNDVEKIAVEKQESEASELSSANVLKIRVWMRHPNPSLEKVSVSQETIAKVEVECETM